MKIGHLVAYPDGSLQFENLSQDVNIMEDYDDSKFMRRSMIVGSRTLGEGNNRATSEQKSYANMRSR